MRRFRQPNRISAVLGCVDRKVHGRLPCVMGDEFFLTTDVWGLRPRKEV